MSFRRYLTFLILVFICLTASEKVLASQIDTQMAHIVQQLVIATRQRDIPAEQMNLAVFPFQAEEKLIKKKVDFAMGEILTHHLVKEGSFRLVERHALQKILDEQKLGQTGAVESETAARVGQILGAHLVALGSVTPVGKSYQILVKLVDTHTTEILSAAVEEVPVQLFDQEAARYLVIVPEKQAIGFYCQVDFAPFVQVSSLPPSTFHDLTLTPTNAHQPFFPPATLGLGIRYAPWSRWMFDLFVTFHTDFGNESENLFTIRDNGTILEPEGNTSYETIIDGRGGRFTVNRLIRIASKVMGYVGAGFEYYELGYVEDTDDTFWIGDTEYRMTVKENRQNHFFPIMRLGLEFRPQSRFGIALFSNFYLKQDTAEFFATLTRTRAEESSSESHTVCVYEMRTPWVMTGLSISVYF